MDSPLSSGDRGKPGLELRSDAADALVHCRLVSNASAATAKALLGRPHREPDARNQWLYTVGPERDRFGLDDEYLVLILRDGRVVDAFLRGG
jgi:hypothetical protein